jgi:hypothetical protein
MEYEYEWSTIVIVLWSCRRRRLPISSRQIGESISIADSFPPNQGVDFYCQMANNGKAGNKWQ